MKDILVGVDGSPGSRAALDHALRLGQLTGRTVCLVNVWSSPAPVSTAVGAGYGYDPSAEMANAKLVAEQLLEAEVKHGLERLVNDAPVTVRVVTRYGSAGPELVDAASSAAILLVGTRGHGRLGNLLGSSLPSVLHHATVPVMVVPTSEEPSTTFRRVVVGVDGSEESRAALLWAHELARVERARLVAVHAVPYGEQPVRTEERMMWHRAVMSSLPLETTVECEVTTAAGGAQDVLPDSVGPGDLLVVGSRGSGALANVLLGSVATACVSHPTVPVLVVKAHEEGLAHLFGPVSEPDALEVG